MKLGLWLCVIACVGVGHLAVIFLIDHWRNLGKPYVPPPEPTFATATYHFVDEQGSEVKRVKEFTVSTKFESDAPKSPAAKPATSQPADGDTKVRQSE